MVGSAPEAGTAPSSVTGGGGRLLWGRVGSGCAESRDFFNNDHHFLSESERRNSGVRDLRRMGESQTLSVQKEKRLISKRWTEPMHHI